MLQSIHFSQRFIKQLQALGKSDRKGILAAGQTELIIAHFRNYGVETGEIRSKRTRHGESRLKNCRKYDLGGGYRLITLQEGGSSSLPVSAAMMIPITGWNGTGARLSARNCSWARGRPSGSASGPGMVPVRRNWSNWRVIPLSNTKRICCAALTRKPCARSSAVFTISDSR